MYVQCILISCLLIYHKSRKYYFEIYSHDFFQLSHFMVILMEFFVTVYANIQTILTYNHFQYKNSHLKFTDFFHNSGLLHIEDFIFWTFAKWRPSSLTHSSSLANMFAKIRLQSNWGNPTDFGSDIFFKLCHSARICFIDD